MSTLTYLPLSPYQREKLKAPCRELGIDMSDYSSDEALVDAITAAILQEVEAEQNPGVGFYQI